MLLMTGTIQQKYLNAEQAKEAYENVKVEGQPASASEMATLWVNMSKPMLRMLKSRRKSS